VNHLRRELAPITDAAWAQISEEAERALKLALAGRKLLELSGPHGWTYSGVDLGHREALDAGPVEAVSAAIRQVAPLVELRTPFELPIDALDDAERGADDLDLDAVVEAATRAAVAEDTIVFHGFPAASITGIGEATPHAPVEIDEDYEQYPRSVAQAVATLRSAGVDGPFGVALGPRCYTGVIETTEDGGYPVLEHIRTIAGGPIVRAPAVDGAFVVSLRGGDYELIVGQDISLGYSSHDDTTVRLYFEESLTFRIASPEAAVRLTYP
jgi:uncharacterized linocin/CFP29 family protein